MEGQKLALVTLMHFYNNGLVYSLANIRPITNHVEVNNDSIENQAHLKPFGLLIDQLVLLQFF